MTMLEGFHLAQPQWLWALLVPPVLWWWPSAKRAVVERDRLARYADRHLLPYLIKGDQSQGASKKRLGLWTLVWALGIVAMTGPRLGYQDVGLYAPGTNLVILLDLSRSMETEDVKPSRLARARQEIEDLLDESEGLRVGLIAFASVSHVVAPITEDADTLRNLLPSISTDLVRWQGSRLSGALERARRLLSGQPQDSVHTLLLITDGDLAEPGLEATIKMFRDQGIKLHVLGVGTPEGGPVPAEKGGWLRSQSGRKVVSRLDEGQLKALARAGGGIYQHADFRDGDTRALLNRIRAEGKPQAEGEGTVRIWDERYYIPVALMMLVLLTWFRRPRAARVIS